MSSSLDLSLYTRLSKESFTLVEPSLVIVKEPSFFKYNKDLKLLLCSTCKFTIYSLNERAIREHLRDFHVNYYTKNIKGIKDSLIINNLLSLESSSLKEIPRILPNLYYFRDLDLYFNGYTCKECLYITINIVEFRRHVSKNHDNTLRGKDIDKSYLIAYIPIQYLYYPKKIGVFIPKLPPLTLEPSLRLSPISWVRQKNTESPSKARAIISRYNLERSTLININPFNDNNYEQYPYITTFKFNDYLKDKDISKLLEDIDISFLTSKNIENTFYIFLFNRVVIVLENISTLIPRLSTSIRLLLKNLDLNTTKIYSFSHEFKALDLETSRISYSKEYSRFLIYLINIYNKEELDSLATREPILSLLIKDLIKELLSYNQSLSKEFNALELEKINTLILDIFYTILETSLEFSTLNIENPRFKNPLLTYFILRIINPIENSYNYSSSGYIASLSSRLLYNSRLTTIARLNKVEQDFITKKIPFSLDNLFISIYNSTIFLEYNKIYKELYMIA